MSKQEKAEAVTVECELDAILDAPVGPPIVPAAGEANKETYYHGKHWKYYQSIRTKLPKWWQEFATTWEPRTNRLRYKTVYAFICTKTKKQDERDLLFEMIGPKPPLDEGERHRVPWLGDWDRVRQNGFWALDNIEKVKPLAQAIKNSLDSSTAIRAAAPFLVQELMRYTRLQDKVDQAFGGEPFLDNKSATDKANALRAKTYIKLLADLTGIKFKVIHEWMRIHGVDPYNPHEMIDMLKVAGGIGAAGALMGAAAFDGLARDAASQLGPSQDALLLASHLTRHAVTFDKPLPVLEGQVSEPTEKKEEKHGKHKVQ